MQTTLEIRFVDDLIDVLQGGALHNIDCMFKDCLVKICDEYALECQIVQNDHSIFISCRQQDKKFYRNLIQNIKRCLENFIHSNANSKKKRLIGTLLRALKHEVQKCLKSGAERTPKKTWVVFGVVQEFFSNLFGINSCTIKNTKR